MCVCCVCAVSQAATIIVRSWRFMKRRFTGRVWRETQRNGLAHVAEVSSKQVAVAKAKSDRLQREMERQRAQMVDLQVENVHSLVTKQRMLTINSEAMSYFA